MPVAWRVVRTRYAESAFSGEGAFRYGGRWNSRGRPMVYTSGSRALAALEILVHLNPPLHFEYRAMQVAMEETHLEKIAVSRLPSDWRSQPSEPETRAIGDRWLRESRSVVLEVPSVIVPEESNFLLNPLHPDFRSLKFSKSQPFSLDPRLIR